MFTKKMFILVLSVLSIAGCAVPQKHAKIIKIDTSGTYAITYPAELRGAYFFNRGDRIQYCAEPVPDIALNTLQKITVELLAKLPEATEAKGKLSTELSSKAVQLAGRTELILLAREMLYRACELNVNHPDTADKAMDMYMLVAELVENLGRAERVLAEAELIRASFEENGTSQCIDSWLDKDEKNVRKLKEWLAKKDLNISIALFIHTKNYAQERSDFVQEYAISCNN